MVPSGWLGDLMTQFEWMPHSGLVTGSMGNVNLTDLKFVGCHNDNWLLIGNLQAPYAQLCCCCLRAEGDSHDCIRHDTRTVILTIPCALTTPAECEKLDSMSIWKAKVEGFASDLFRFDVAKETDLAVLGALRDHVRNDSADTKVPPASVGSPGVQVVESQAPEVTTASDASVLPGAGLSPVHSLPDPCTDSPLGNRSHCAATLVDSPCSDLSGLSLSNCADVLRLLESFHDHLGSCPVLGFLPGLSHACMRSARSCVPVGPWALVELFAGSFAGWKQVAGVMTKHGFPWTSTHAVEIDVHVAELYKLNHDVFRVLHDVDPLFDTPLTVTKSDDFRDSLFVGDATGFKWIKTIPWDSSLVVAMSPPCPPWSRSSDKDGLLHEDGRAFLETVALLRLVQPRAVAVENVDGLPKHPHFGAITDAFKWAGFKLAWSCISDLGDVAPVSRSRWLAVFVPLDSHVSGHPGHLLPLPKLNLASFGAFVALPPVHEWELTLGPELLEMYSSLDYAFRGDRSKSASSEQVLSRRVKDGSASLSTVVAHYGAQHLLSPQSLKQRGLFAELYQGAFGVRFFSPFELAILHGVIGRFVIPVQSQLGHKSVGNSIATPHAALALAAARAFVDKEVSLDPREFVLLCLRERLHDGNSRVIALDSKHLALVPIAETCNEVVDLRPTRSGVDACHSGELPQCGFDAGGFACPPTLPFTCQVVVVCHLHFDTHHLVAFVGSKLIDLLSLHQLSHDDLVPVDSEGTVLDLNMVIDGDMTVYFLDLAPGIRQLLLCGFSWTLVHFGESVRSTLQTAKFPQDISRVMAFGITLQEVGLDYQHDRDTPVMVSREPLLSTIAGCPIFDWTSGLSVCLAAIRHTLPVVQVAFDELVFSAPYEDAKPAVLGFLSSLFRTMDPVLRCVGWTSTNIICADGDLALATMVPLDFASAPVYLIDNAMIRCVFQAVLPAAQHDACDLRLKLNGCIIWEGSVPVALRVVEFVEIIELILVLLGVGRVAWIEGGRIMDDGGVFRDKTNRGPVIRLSVMPRIRGGGGKIDTWKETKALLGRELITQGWPVKGLDTVTTEWVRRIGQNKLFGTLRQDLSSAKRWGLLTEMAKRCGLAIQPDDATKLQAASTIQRALRKRLNFEMPPVENFTLQDGFFVDVNGSAVRVLKSVELTHSGICLVDWPTAELWLGKELPIVSDELAILTLHQENPNVDVSKAKAITFPATDVKGRQVVLKGHLWQLGEKEVHLSSYGGDIVIPETVVVAATVWRDECSEAEWTDVSQSLVKTVFAMLADIDSKHVLNVWGRCFRDAQKRVDPSVALSGQFHFRILTSVVEKALKLSQGPVYLTPKDEKHMAHSGWTLFWFSDLTEAKIALSKVSTQSGLARARGRYGLRVMSSAASAIIKELKLPADQAVLPVSLMYKLQPVPLGAQPSDIVEWAKGTTWNIKVIKMLGREAALIGTNQPPPHQHLRMNGTPVMIKEVAQRSDAAPSPIVAGPKTFPAPKKNGLPDLAHDPWAPYKAQKEATARSIPATATAAPAALRQVDAPTATKFSALEDRMSKFETDLQALQEKQVLVGKTLESQQKTTANIENKVGQIQQQLHTTVEQAISSAMSSQTKALDKKFEGLMRMMTSNAAAVPTATKRPNTAVGDSDAEMESPQKGVGK